MKKALIHRALPLLVTFILALGMVFGSFSAAFAAEEVKELAFDKTNVLDDLQGSTDSEGNPFDLTQYPYNEYGSIQLVNFAEYCYSYAANMRGNYGLYLYIYNPQALDIDEDSVLNQVQLAVSWNADGEPEQQDKFDIVFCNKSGGDYADLFYKYRIVDKVSSYDGKTIAERVNSNGRKYSITGIELLTEGETNSTDYGVGGTYTYTGYAAGYGADADAESTLACTVTPFETVELDVHHTYYRAEGDYYMGMQTQLDSVFFNVPQRLYEEYGELYEIACRWYEYKTNPALVTENLEKYNALSPYIGKDVFSIEGMTVAVLGFGNASRNWFGTTYVTPLQAYVNLPDEAFKDEDGNWIDLSGKTEWDNIFGFKLLKIPADVVEKTVQNRFGVLSDVIFANGEATDYSASSDEVRERLLELSEQLGGDMINGKYAEVLFSDEVDEGHKRGINEKTIKADDKMTLTEYTTELLASAWLNGQYHVSEQYKQLPAIVTVSADDLVGDDATVAARLYIAEEDVPELRTKFALGQLNRENTVLFRFSTSTYNSQYAGAYIIPDSNTELPREGVLVGSYIPVFRFTENDYDAAQFDEVLISETVYLDFDIISLTFKDEEGAETVLPVVSSPIDAIAGYTPPLDTDYHTGGDSTWIWIVIAVVVAIVLILLLIFCPQVFVYLFKAIFFVISLPFRAIAALINAIKKSRADKPKKDKLPKDKPKGDGGGGSGGKTESAAPVVNVYVGGARTATKKAGGTAKAAGTSKATAQGKSAGGAKTKAKAAGGKAGGKAEGGEKKSAARSQSGTNVTARGGEKNRAGNRANGKNVTAKKNSK